MSYLSTVLADSPLVYLPLQETGGTTAADLSGNDHDGTYANVTLNALGPFPTSRAVVFDHTSAAVTVASAAALNVSAGQSVELWMRYQTGTAQFCRLACRNNTSDGFNLALGDGTAGSTAVAARWRHSSTDYKAVSSAAVVSRGVWAHLVMTLSDANAVTIYVNGVSVATTTDSGSVQGDTSLRLGQQASSTNRLVGRMAHFAYYDYELSSESVAAHYAASTASVKAAALKVYDGTAWQRVK